MAQQYGSGGSSDDVRFLSRNEIISATVADALVMIASLRVTLLAGGIAGALAPLAFAVPVALAVGLFPILNSLMVALMAGALLFAIVLTPLVILSGFWERMRTFQIIEGAAALIILVVVIIAVLTIRNTETPIGIGTLFGVVLTVVAVVWNILPVILGAGALGAVMALFRRLQAKHNVYWRITFGPIVSSYFGPHQVLSFIAVPVGLMVALAAAFTNGWSFALQVFPVWILSGFSLLGLLGTRPHAHLGHDHRACRVVSQKPCPRESLGGRFGPLRDTVRVRRCRPGTRCGANSRGFSRPGPGIPRPPGLLARCRHRRRGGGRHQQPFLLMHAV